VQYPGLNRFGENHNAVSGTRCVSSKEKPCCWRLLIHPTGLLLLALTRLNKVKLLIPAVGDRHRVKPEPPVHQGGVGTTEIVVKVEIAFELILVPQRRILTVRPAMHRRSHDKRYAAGAVIRACTIVSDAATKFREHEYDHVLIFALLLQVIHEGADGGRDLRPEFGMTREFCSMGVEIPMLGV